MANTGVNTDDASAESQLLDPEGNPSDIEAAVDQRYPKEDHGDMQAAEEQKNQNRERLDHLLFLIVFFLALLGFRQSSIWRGFVVWIVFILTGLVIPVVILERMRCGDDAGKCVMYELQIVVFQAVLAAVSLIFVSWNLRKFEIKKFLSVDESSAFAVEYLEEMKKSGWLLLILMSLCFGLKMLIECLCYFSVHRELWWVRLLISLGLAVSWTYTCTVYLSACVMFYLMCNLQIIHFDDYAKKLLVAEGDVSELRAQHVDLGNYLSKISHMFRTFLVLGFLVVSASQFITLFQTTGFSGKITLISRGDFALSSVVQVVGVILCLTGATKISLRAQGIASVACRCQFREGNAEAQGAYEEPLNSQLLSHISSNHNCQLFVLYLQNNPMGITIYGWVVDRGLIITIFFIELSLITFVLGKTIIFPA